MDRPSENLSSRLCPNDGNSAPDIAGAFRSAEYDATLTCIERGGALYGAFSGIFGQGLMQPLLPTGPDVWRLPCPRSLDFSPPGDWTLAFRRDGGKVTSVRVGCWLARGIDFHREG
jgi:D-aminopeptidase